MALNIHNSTIIILTLLLLAMTLHKLQIYFIKGKFQNTRAHLAHIINFIVIILLVSGE